MTGERLEKDADRESKPNHRLNPDDRIEKRVREVTEDGRLACAMAFKVAEELKVSRLAVGEAADRVGIHIKHAETCPEFMQQGSQSRLHVMTEVTVATAHQGQFNYHRSNP